MADLSLINKARRLKRRVEEAAKNTIREVYWAVAHEEDEHNNRLAVFYFKPDADDDVVVARVEDAIQRMTGTAPGRITRHRKGSDDAEG